MSPTSDLVRQVAEHGMQLYTRSSGQSGRMYSGIVTQLNMLSPHLWRQPTLQEEPYLLHLMNEYWKDNSRDSAASHWTSQHQMMQFLVNLTNRGSLTRWQEHLLDLQDVEEDQQQGDWDSWQKGMLSRGKEVDLGKYLYLYQLSLDNNYPRIALLRRSHHSSHRSKQSMETSQ